MVTGSILFWTFSYLFALFTAHRIRAPLISNFTVFLGFSFMYTFFPLLVSRGIQPELFYNAHLNFRLDLITTHLLMTGLGNLAYCVGRLLGRRSVWRPSTPTDRHFELRQRYSFVDHAVFLGFLGLVLVLAYAGGTFRWGSVRGEGVNSILGQAKVLLGGVYAYYLAYFGLRPRVILMLFLIIVVTLIEGSRTTLISITIATLIIAREDRRISNTMLAALGVLSVGFFIYIAIIRINLSFSDLANAFDFFFPLFIEGTYGSYMSLQAYELMANFEAQPTFFLSYILDPLVFLVPRLWLLGVGIDKNSLTILSNWIDNYGSYLAEPFALYGGFFYVTEAFIALPFIGPPVIAFFFALATNWAEKRRFRSLRGRFRFVVFTVGFAMVFIKNPFAASTNFYVTTFLAAALVAALNLAVGHIRLVWGTPLPAPSQPGQ